MHISSNAKPNSACFNANAICYTVNFIRFMVFLIKLNYIKTPKFSNLGMYEILDRGQYKLLTGLFLKQLFFKKRHLKN